MKTALKQQQGEHEAERHQLAWLGSRGKNHERQSMKSKGQDRKGQTNYEKRYALWPCR